MPRLAGVQGIYTVFWWRCIPLGEIRILNGDLPLNPSQVARLAIKAITPAAGNYLIEEGFRAPLGKVPGKESHEALPSLSALMEIDRPLKMLEEKLLREEPPDIPTSVVICTRDRSASLKGCLNSLTALTRRPLEILVVDNAPQSDETFLNVSSMDGVRYILEPRPGLDIARNTGVFYSSGDIIAFLDDDVTVHPDWLLSLQRAFLNQKVMAVTGLVLAAEMETEAQYIFERHWRFNRGYRAKTFDELYFSKTMHQGTPVWEIGAGANMAFRREAFVHMGLFDERLDVGAAGCSGDSEFWYRVLAEGFSCRYEPASVVYHYHRRHMEGFKDQIFYYMRGHVSALLIQFERYRHWGNLRRLGFTLPRYYINLILNRLRSGSTTRNITLIREIAGCFSGVKFYLFNLMGRGGEYPSHSLVNHQNSMHVQAGAGANNGDNRGSPLVSVVIPCFNQAEFLGEAIKSVLMQTYPHVEIIIVDDGSTDHTRDTAAGFPGIGYIIQNNQGLSAARNTGVRASRGYYIVFLDADDRLLPAALESGVRCFRSHQDCAFVFGQHDYFTSEAKGSEHMRNPPSETNLYLASLRGSKDPYRSLLYGNYIGMHASVMYRRDIFRSVKGFDPRLKAAEDYELYLRITKNHPVCFHDAVVAEYRSHGRNMTRDPELMLRSVLSVLRSQRTYIKGDNNCREAYLRGRKFWINNYGYDLIGQLTAQLSSPGYRIRSLRGVATLIEHAPAWFFSYIVNSGKIFIKRTIKSLWSVSVPAFFRRKAESSTAVPAPGNIDFGDLRRLSPSANESLNCHNDSIRDHYIEQFFAENSVRIQGLILETECSRVTARYGRGEVTGRDVLRLKDGGCLDETGRISLGGLTHVPSNIYDCLILPETLQHVYDLKAFLKELYRILKKGGVFLATVPGICKSTRDEQGKSHFWSFTRTSVQRMLEEVFPRSCVSVNSYGNVTSAVALMHGLKTGELKPAELDFIDPLFQVVISMRAEKL